MVYTVGIIGFGTLGKQLTELFGKKKFNLVIITRNPQKVEIFLKQLSQKPKNVKVSNNFEELQNCDIIIECVEENLNTKQKIFKEIEKNAKKEAVICSNTSSFSIEKIAKLCQNKDNIAGLHFSNPATKMLFLEIAYTKNTSNTALKKLISLSGKIDKKPIVVKDSPGLIFNKIMFAMLNQAAKVYESKLAKREDIDTAMIRGANHPSGPLRIIDYVGVDVTLNILENLYKELHDSVYRPAKILSEMKKAGKLGKKTGEGFYKYADKR